VDVFGRTKTPQPQPTTPAAAETSRTGGKGRATPSRREAEARNKRPIVGGSPAAVRADATKEEKKAAKAARREAWNADRIKQREALISGDDRYLPERDRGPARRFARDYVDARHSAGEYLLVAVLTVLLLSMVPYDPIKPATVIMLYGLVLVVGVDTWLLRRRVQRLATAKFGADKARGVGGYAMMRALQLRRTRLPRAMNKRGEFPS
jgi:hypothetical protein